MKLIISNKIRFTQEAAGGGRDSEVEDDEGMLTERERVLRLKLQELQMKKQHMENLVSIFSVKYKLYDLI